VEFLLEKNYVYIQNRSSKIILSNSIQKIGTATGHATFSLFTQVVGVPAVQSQGSPVVLGHDS